MLNQSIYHCLELDHLILSGAVLLLTSGGDGHSAHLLLALHDLNPAAAILVRPLGAVALVHALVRRRHAVDDQLEDAVPAGHQPHAAVGVAPGELGSNGHLTLRAEGQDVLGQCPALDRPRDRQVGGVGELPGDVACQGEVVPLQDYWGRGLWGHLERVWDHCMREGRGRKGGGEEESNQECGNIAQIFKRCL